MPYTNIFVIIVSYLFHNKLYQYLWKNKEVLMMLAIETHKKRYPDVVSLIMLPIHIIPDSIKTVEKEARNLLRALQKAPHFYYLFKKEFDKFYIRFGWLKIEKGDYNYFKNQLETGDGIYYHNNKSWLGRTIRFFTRCYWEHTGIYHKEGKLLESTLRGWRISELKEWFDDPDVELAVLRTPVGSKVIKNESVEKLIKEVKGKPYGYLKALLIFWSILTGRLDRVPMISLFQLIMTLIMISIGFLLLEVLPNSVAILIVYLLILESYISDISYNKYAYQKEYPKLKG